MILLLAVVAGSAAADHYRSRRREVDRSAGRSALIPWAWIMVTALIGFAFCARMWLIDG